MSDVSHAKFISSYHSNGEETNVPDLFYRYNQQFVNVYSRIEKNKLISTVTTGDLDNIAGEQQLTIQHVLEATFRKKPILMIVTTTSKSTDDFIKPSIYVFWHRVLENNTKMIHFDLPMVGEISAIAMTSQPLVLVQKSGKEIRHEKHLRHLLVFGKPDQYLQVALLHDASFDDKRVRGQVTEFKLPSQTPGGITALHILPQSTNDKRLGYSDPRIFVGASDGYIQVLRFQAQVRKQTILPGYTWEDLVLEGNNKPITYLTCVRARENHGVIAAIAQERTYKSLYDGDGDDSAHDDNEGNDINDNDNEDSDNVSLWVIEWPGNYHRKILDRLSPTKLSSSTLSTTRIIPGPNKNNYQLTAIFQSTQDKQHFEVDVWTIETNGKATLVVCDEIYEHDIKHSPKDIWPIQETSKYILLDPESDLIEIANPDTGAYVPMEQSSAQDIQEDELSKEYDVPQSLNDKLQTNDIDTLGTPDFTSACAQGGGDDDGDERHNITANDEKETVTEDVDSTMMTDNELENSSSIPSDHDEKETTTDIEDSMEPIDNHNDLDKPASLIQNDYEKRTNSASVDSDDDLKSQSMDYDDDDDANDVLDFDFSDQDHEEPQWQNGDAAVRLGDRMDDVYSKSDVRGANGLNILDGNNETFEKENFNNSSTVTNGDDNAETKGNKMGDILQLDNQIIEPLVDMQPEQITMVQSELETSKNGNNDTDVLNGSSHDEHDTAIEQQHLDLHDTSENTNDSNNNIENSPHTMNLGKPTIVEHDETVINETTAETGNDSGTRNSSNSSNSSKISIDNRTRSDIMEKDDTTTPNSPLDITNKEILIFEDDGINNDFPGNDTASPANEAFTREQKLHHTLSSARIPFVGENYERLLDNTTDCLFKLERNVTGLGNNNNNNFRTTSGTAPLSPSTSPPSVIYLGTKEKEPLTPKAIYKAKVKKVTESSLSDGLNMVRKDETAGLNRRERLWVIFDIIFSMTTTATTKGLDINKAMKTLEDLSLDAMEQDWLMGYCFSNENQLLKLLCMRYNIEHGNFGLVMMQHKTMKSMENSVRSRQGNHSQPSQAHGGEKATSAIKRTCNNLAKLSQDMVPSVLQDLPLEIFGQSRGKVGNPFLNEEKPSLLQDKGLGLGGELLAQVMEGRKRRRLN